MIDVKAARARIAGWRGAFEEKLAAFVEIPTVSMDPTRRPEMDRCVAAARDALAELGARVDVVETGGFPLVLGRVTRDPSYPTVTVYNHLDVQPADPAEWNSPPFTFTRQGDRYVARGATDDKGPALTALYGAKLALETDARVNVQFLWELEEEIGSPNFGRGLGSATTAAGFATESVVVSDTIWTAAGKPSIPYGLRGLMGFTVSLQTGAKGVHSGTTGGAARNTVAERAGFGRAGFSARRFKAAHELKSLRPHADDLRVMESIMAQPTFEVHGIVGGYSGPGIKTIVPHRAEAKLSTRLVPDQDPAKVFRLIKAFIKKQLPDAQVEHEASLAPYLAPLGGPYNAAAVRAMRDTFGKEPGFTREGGSIGAVLTMRKLLKAPVIFMGLSLPEHGYHAINEDYDWGQASGGMEMFGRFFHELAALPRPRPPGPSRRSP